MTPDYQYIFQSSPLLILVLSPELIIIDATDAYLEATLKKREELVGVSVYEAFPDNPADPNPQGVANLKATFARVLEHKVPDAMGELKYDILRNDGTYETRYWTTMNTPVLDEKGDIKHIVNHVMDITDYAVMRERDKLQTQLTNELRQRAENMEGEIYLRVKQLQAANEKMGLANADLRNTKEELQVANEELQATQEELRVQQEELTELNAELTLNNEGMKKAGMALMLKAEELERSSSFKTDFLSNMSHELRTPLNSMLILSKLLSNNTTRNLTPKQVEQASIIHRAGNDLLKLINDILDLSKIEAGKIEMVMEQTGINSVVTGITDIFSSIAAQKEIKFGVAIASNAPQQIQTDRFRLEQILKNLLSNAFKFTEKDGSVTLSIDMAPPDIRFSKDTLQSNKMNVVRLGITDTGIGIPADKQSAIFDAFTQADGSTSRKYGGTGLGLSISRQLANLLGGEIQLKSEQGKGSTFYLYLPAAYSQPAANSEVKEIETSPASANYVTIKHSTIPATPSEHLKALMKGKVILITDDDDRNLMALQMVLDNYGPKIITATTGMEALKALEENEQIDLVLMDIMMPEMDGYETINKIRENSRYKSLPIIVLTAKGMKSDLEQSIAVGASDYLAKPIDVKHLLSVMEVWLKSNGKNSN